MNVLSYLPAEGLYALREQLAKRGRRFGFATEPDEIVVTSGAQQGLRLAAEATLEEGDVAVVESPSFIGMIGSLRATGARVIGVPVDEHGLDVDALERLLTRHEVQARGAPDRVPQPDRVRPRARQGAPAGRAGDGAQLLRARGPGVRRHAARGRARRDRSASSPPRT